MNISKKHFLLTFFIIIAISISAYFLYFSISLQNIASINAIPKTASIIFKINDFEKFNEEISSKNNILNALCNTKNLIKANGKINIIDSLLKNDNTLASIINTNKLYISIHNINKNNADVLFTLKLKNNYQKTYFNNLIKKLLKKNEVVNTIAYKNCKIKYIISTENNNLLSYTIYKGIFLFSTNPQIIKQSVNKLSSINPNSKDKTLEKLRLIEGKKTLGNIYINYKNINNLLNTFSKTKFTKDIEPISQFALWSDLDITLKNEEIFLSGYTSSLNTNKNFLSVFNNQTPQNNNQINYYPDNTVFFINYGFSSFNTFYKNYKKYLKENNKIINFNNTTKNLSLKYKTDIEKNLRFCLGNKIGLFITDNTNIADNTFAIFKINDLKKTKTYFNWLSKQSKTKFKTLKYRGYRIMHIDIENFIPTYFGEIFSNINTSYYTIIDNNIIFANNYKSLKTLIKKYNLQKTLNKNNEYKNFEKNTSEKSNIYLFYNIKNSETLKNYYLKNIGLTATGNSDKFQSISLQYSNEDNLIYTNFYLKYNSKYKKKTHKPYKEENIKKETIAGREEKESIIKIKLGNEIYHQPYSVKSHTSKDPLIIAFDVSNKMYLINNSGKIIWKKSLKKKPLSKIYIVDYYKNGRLQYLFNTSNYLYLVDVKGRNVANYPIKLKHKATNGISVFDYDKKRNYRIVYAAINNRIYNLNIQGKAVRGWRTPKVKHKVNSYIQHLRTNKKDYIIIPQKNGNVLMTDRRGVTRITIIKSFVNSVNSDFYINKTNNKGKIITTDKSGQLIYTSTKGKIAKTYFNKFSKNHFFLYNDFNDNKNNDFIFLDKNKLTIYNRYKKRILSHTFSNNINTKPIFTQIRGKNNILGVIDEKSNEIFLFNKNGLIKTKNKLTGQTPYIIEKINNSLKLITGYKNYVYIYSIP